MPAKIPDPEWAWYFSSLQPVVRSSGSTKLIVLNWSTVNIAMNALNCHCSIKSVSFSLLFSVFIQSNGPNHAYLAYFHSFRFN